MIGIIGAVVDAGPDTAVGAANGAELAGPTLNGDTVVVGACSCTVPNEVATEGIADAEAADDGAACSILGTAPS